MMGSMKTPTTICTIRTAAPLIHAIAALGRRIVPPQRGQKRAEGGWGAGQAQARGVVSIVEYSTCSTVPLRQCLETSATFG